MEPEDLKELEQIFEDAVANYGTANTGARVLALKERVPNVFWTREFADLCMKHCEALEVSHNEWAARQKGEGR